MKSMTGFGRAAGATGRWQVEVEVSSLNRRQAELVMSLPPGLQFQEPELRKVVRPLFARGRLNVVVRLVSLDGCSELRLDCEKVLALEAAVREVAERLGRPLVPSVGDFLALPEVLRASSPREDPDLGVVLREVVLEAVGCLLEMRALEGRDLECDLLGRLEVLRGLVGVMAEVAPEVPVRQRVLLHERLARAGLSLDLGDERLVKEVALFAERADVTEELTRLRSHFDKFVGLVRGGGPCGRELDFLCQEVHRELNTVGVKSGDQRMVHAVVEAKAELEKIREQVQNVE